MDGFVSVPELEYYALQADAGAWRLLQQSPHLVELLAEFIEWDRRRTERETAAAVQSGNVEWVYPTYAELERRRWGADAPRYAAERRFHQQHARPVAGCPLCRNTL
jgi:hypothetical protein